MISLTRAVDRVLEAKSASGKPLAAILAGHNGSGKSTLWRRSLSEILRIPLINADRMMLSILPEPADDGHLPAWASQLRDTDRSWMKVAQEGVSAFVGHAIGVKTSFAMETVFSEWRPLPDGRIASKIDRIREMQAAGYFVVLFFVGLESADLSFFRVQTRVAEGGHDVEAHTLFNRFARTQKAISEAIKVADASILADNSRRKSDAFTPCRVQLGSEVIFDIRSGNQPTPEVISKWLDLVAPLV